MKRKLLFQIVLLLTTTTLFAQVNLKNGLVAYYPFSGNTNDKSGNDNNGIATGLTLTQDRFGNANSAYSFNGTNSVITTPVYTGFSNQISLCAWFKTAYNDYGGIITSRSGDKIVTALSTNKLGAPWFYTSDGVADNAAYTSISNININVNDDKWHFMVGTYDGTTRRLYIDGVLSKELSGYSYSLFIQNQFKIGLDELVGNPHYFNGKIDDVLIYNRALKTTEVSQLYTDGFCINSTMNDTTVYTVASESFKTISPKYQLLKIDSLKTKLGGCDSIISRYAKFEYNPNVCTVTNSISVTDTLIIQLVIGGTTNPTTNIIKMYPNPAKDYINVDFGDYTKMAGCIMIIRNEVGSVVSFLPVAQTKTIVDIKNWAKGIYIVQILNNSSIIIDTRKVIIQ